MLKKYIFSRKKELVRATYAIKRVHDILRNLGVDINALPAKFLDQLIAIAIDALYVNRNGYDLLLGEDRISCKSLKKMFQKKGTGQIILAKKLSEGKKKRKNVLRIEDIEYELFIFVQTYLKFGIAIAYYKDVEQFIVQKDHSYIIQVPNEYLDFVIHPDEDLISNYSLKDEECLSPLKGIADGSLVKAIWDNVQKG